MEREYDRIELEPGEHVTLWFGVNVKGTVHFKIGNASGSNRLNLWWIKYGPFHYGKPEEIGLRQGSGKLDVPGGFSVAAKLRAGSADSRTVVYITESLQVANDFPNIRF